MGLHINGFFMEYQDQGSGIPLLLIHGYPLNSTLWKPQIEGLIDTARIITPDLRGFGGSDPVEGVYTMDLLARDCKELLDNLGEKQRIVVGGLSMGGYVTLAFQRLFPERVEAMILAATRPGPDSTEAKANRDRGVETALEQGTPAIVDSMLPKMMSPKTYAEKPDLVRFSRNIMETSSVEGIIGALQGMKDRPDSTPLLPHINKPVLILHGADDQLIPVKEAEAMQAAIPNAQLQILPDAGHLLNIEQPELFNKAIEQFLISLA